MRRWMATGHTDVLPDLRRPSLREHAATLCERADAFDPPDRELLLAYFGAGRNAVQLAQLTGRTPRWVRSHLRRLAARALDPAFLYVARADAGWTPTRRAVGRACFISGLSLRAAARSLHLSLHTVRRNRLAILALVEAARPSPATRRNAGAAA